ncbi:MAG TPA: hypothetical protein VHW01_06385 [Polyangiaceae bacterium]|nr:hypothetical protein [Polyangiaceae bacterium]
MLLPWPLPSLNDQRTRTILEGIGVVQMQMFTGRDGTLSQRKEVIPKRLELT